MTTRSVQQAIRIRAKPSEVWSSLVAPAKLARWMGGTQVDSTWEPGSAMTFTWTVRGRPLRDRGTVLACEPARLLRYNHWSVISRLPDSDETRTVITLTLTPEGDETSLEVSHENLASDEAFGHARFFWRNALPDVKNIVERA
ncbi:MAG: hypothetical protein GEV06_18870 [Luteitalea sp.]|nr:hypothetical protein [Luteitalea sp.]